MDVISAYFVHRRREFCINMNKLTTMSVITLTLLSVQSFANGGLLYEALGCIGCHGPDGKSTLTAYPSLAGKPAAYIVKQLKDFQSGARKNATMNAIAPMVAGKEQAIADYLAAE